MIRTLQLDWRLLGPICLVELAPCALHHAGRELKPALSNSRINGPATGTFSIEDDHTSGPTGAVRRPV